MNPSMVGRTIRQYRVLDRLGHGGMGTVYHAIDELLEREVALKVLAAELDDREKRFRTEAISLARLGHPGIATVHELFEHEGHWVMVMELVRGQTLEQVVEQTGVLSPQRAGDLCMQALTALAHAHSAGVVHRDLKPSNLMLTESGAVKILDFGIARMDGSVHLTHAGLMIGTPAYMAPEQVHGQDVDHRADLYAVGVIFYRLVTAALPFHGETAFAMAQSQVTDPPTPIELIRSDLPRWVPEIVHRALAKAPDERFQTAIEFREGFACGLAGLPLPSRDTAGTVTEVMIRPSSTVSTGSLLHQPPPSSPSVPTADATPMPLKPWLVSARRGYRSFGLAVRRPHVAAWMGMAGAGISVLWLGLSAGVPAPNGTVAPARAVDTSSAATAGRGATRVEATTPRNVGASSVTNVPSMPSARSTTGGDRAASNGAPAPAMFSNVKLLVVNGGRTNDRDVLLSFSTGEIVAVPNGGSAPITTVPYGRIAKATYVHARNPQWDPLLSAPAGRINVPGILGRARHWLVVQTSKTYAILRLDGDDWSEVLEMFKARTGVTIDRPLATDK